MRADPRPGLRDPHQRPGLSQPQDAPDGRAARRGTQHRRELRQHRDIAHAGGTQRDRDRHRHDNHTPAELRERPRPRQRTLQRGRQPALIGQLPQQHRAAVPHQARPVPGDFQAMIPAVILHDEERSSPEVTWCGYRVISQNQGALRR
jgi:hypothetical protein